MKLLNISVTCVTIRQHHRVPHIWKLFLNVLSICVQYYVTIHIEAIHDSDKYMCTICDYLETDKANLKIHEEIIHEGVVICVTIYLHNIITKKVL